MVKRSAQNKEQRPHMFLRVLVTIAPAMSGFSVTLELQTYYQEPRKQKSYDHESLNFQLVGGKSHQSYG